MIPTTGKFKDFQTFDEVVRVAGYSAFFAELSRGIQDEIIARSEHSL